MGEEAVDANLNAMASTGIAETQVFLRTADPLPGGSEAVHTVSASPFSALPCSE